MACDLYEFVNRKAEIDTFSQLLAHRRQRILLLHGLPGIGKSCTIRRLRRVCRNHPNLLTALVDFGSRRPLSQVKQVMEHLREQIRGPFAQQLAQVELQIQREFGGLMGMAPSAETFSSMFSTVGDSGNVFLSGQVSVGGDVVGGNKLTISNSSLIFNPAGGTAFAQSEIDTRRNMAFRQALSSLLMKQKVVLFVDHFEKATEEVAAWLQQHLLEPLLEGEEEFRNLWLVIAGDRVPLQDEAYRWRHVVRSQKIGPLMEDAIRAFWVEKRNLDPSALMFVQQATLGKPDLLFMIANNFAFSMQRA